MSVEDETNLIEFLEKQKAPPEPDWWRFITILRDAYWRRRMKSCKTKEEKEICARIG